MLWQILIWITAIATAALLWWWMPKWQMRSVVAEEPKDRADIEDNFRKTVGQALGGIAVLTGAAMAYSGTQQTLQGSKEQALLSEKASRDLLISNQVSKGFEQLSGDKVVIRLGGIYALEGVMHGSEDYRQPVLEALCAFVRDGTKDIVHDQQPATDIQATMTVIGRRGEGKGHVDLTAARLPNLRLESADLSKAYLSGAVLTGADLKQAGLGGAILDKADLSKADLGLAGLDEAFLESTNLTNANLFGASLYRAHLSEANLANANLTKADLKWADLSGANLSEALMSGADLTDADLTDGDLTNATLTHVTVRFPIGITYEYADAKISQAQLDKACGMNAKLPQGLKLNKSCIKKN
jgi:uncharacterized protein YjbI with pentapeptide repeats